MPLPASVAFPDAVTVTMLPFGDQMVVGVTDSVTAGRVVSRTVTVKLPEATFPAASAAEQLTTVTPSGKTLPDVRVHVGVTAPPTMSRAVAVKVTALPCGPVASTVMLAGTVTTGGLLSRTVTSNDPVPVLLALSVAEHVTVVVPSRNVDPEAGSS